MSRPLKPPPGFPSIPNSGRNAPHLMARIQSVFDSLPEVTAMDQGNDQAIIALLDVAEEIDDSLKAKLLSGQKDIDVYFINVNGKMDGVERHKILISQVPEANNAETNWAYPIDNFPLILKKYKTVTVLQAAPLQNIGQAYQIAYFAWNACYVRQFNYGICGVVGASFNSQGPAAQAASQHLLAQSRNHFVLDTTNTPFLIPKDIMEFMPEFIDPVTQLFIKNTFGCAPPQAGPYIPHLRGPGGNNWKSVKTFYETVRKKDFMSISLEGSEFWVDMVNDFFDKVESRCGQDGHTLQTHPEAIKRRHLPRPIQSVHEQKEGLLRCCIALEDVLLNTDCRAKYQEIILSTDAELSSSYISKNPIWLWFSQQLKDKPEQYADMETTPGYDLAFGITALHFIRGKEMWPNEIISIPEGTTLREMYLSIFEDTSVDDELSSDDEEMLCLPPATLRRCVTGFHPCGDPVVFHDAGMYDTGSSEEE